MYSVKIIEDSLHYDTKSRLVTYQLSYPRISHAELMTHRVFSRNASSSRAIPFKKMLENIKSDTYYPIFWGKNKPGMKADEEIEDKVRAIQIWERMRNVCIEGCRELSEELNVHKEICNRPLEWCSYISVIVTSSDFINFFALRKHPDAQREIQKLAEMMLNLYKNSQPKTLQFGQFHLPYVTDQERQNLAPDLALRVSAARCCRVSYLLHDGNKPSIEKDLELYEKLAGAVPLHSSPLEHQAMANDKPTNLSGNFHKCWVQFRKTIPNENITEWPDYLL